MAGNWVCVGVESCEEKGLGVLMMPRTVSCCRFHLYKYEYWIRRLVDAWCLTGYFCMNFPRMVWVDMLPSSRLIASSMFLRISDFLSFFY